MRRIRASLNKLVYQSVFFAAAIVCGFYVITLIPAPVYFGFGIVFITGLLILFSSKKGSKQYINERGYVVLVAENDLEHRVIAKRILNRSLKDNEVVHHINGKRTDNKIDNLCLMDKEKHELFHSWLSWKRKKSGKYPSFKDQKRMLEGEYGGVLLKHVTPQKPSVKSATRFDFVNTQSEISKTYSEPKPSYNSESIKILFEDLRAERLRLARERNVPAYMIFYDKTLHRMTHMMPDSDYLMIKTVGPSKYQKYGPEFIAVIQKFKVNHANGKLKGTGTS